MFPYDEPPLNKISTGQDIYRFGHQSLLRALNIGRVVAFSGSGASYLFGQPTWQELKDKAFGIVEKFCDNKRVAAHRKAPKSLFSQEYKAHIEPLYEDIERLKNKDALDAPEFIYLCEQAFGQIEDIVQRHGLFKAIDPSAHAPDDLPLSRDDFRREMARAFLSAEAASSDSQTTSTKWFDDEKKKGKFKYLSDEICAELRKRLEKVPDGPGGSVPPGLRWSKSTWLNVTTALNTVYPSGHPAALDSVIKANALAPHEDLARLDTSRALFKSLGIRRFITLNYDLEIERMLAEESRSAPSRPFDAFRAFLDDPLGDKDPASHRSKWTPGHPVTIQSGSGRVLRSTASRQDSLADLFAFGAFPTNFDSSVHHLHGRVDDPANMVLSTLDYQRVYYDTTSRKRSFDEARHAVFTGSDVLLYGIGHSEDDVLRPFREFILQEPDRRDFFGKVYYLTAAALDQAPDVETAYDDTRNRSLALTQKLHQQNGFFTIFADFSLAPVKQWSDAAKVLFSARAEVANYKSALGGLKGAFATLKEHVSPDGPAIPENSLYEALGTLATTMSKALWQDPGTEMRFYVAAPEDHPGRSEALMARHAITSVRDAINDPLRDTAEKCREALALRKLLAALNQRLRSLSTVAKIEQLHVEQDDWWAKWSKLPGLRWAVFGPHSYETTQEDPLELTLTDDLAKMSRDAPMIWRQTNLVSHMGTKALPLGDKTKTPLITDLLEKTRIAAERAEKDAVKHPQPDGCLPYPAAVARVSMPPGAGKGRLNAVLHSQQLLDCTKVPHARTRFDGVPEESGGGRRCYPFQLLFPRHREDAETAIHYVGSFSIHLTFSLEFSSIIFGLLRYLLGYLRHHLDARRLDEEDKRRFDHLIGYQFQQARADRRLGLEMLDVAFDLLVIANRQHNGQRRVMLTISYLDRLLDGSGTAGSPTHRFFFRMLSGIHKTDRHKNLPIDFLFVNSNPGKPVRYLSEERQLEQFQQAVRKGTAQDEEWLLIPELDIAVRNWDELATAEPVEMYRESVRHSLHLAREKATNAAGELTDYNFFGDIEGETECVLGLMGVSVDKTRHTIRREVDIFAKRRVFNGFCVAGLACEIWKRVKDDHPIRARQSAAEKTAQVTAQDTAFAEHWQATCRRLAKAYVTRKNVGFFAELLEVYRQMDRVYETPSPRNPARNTESNESRNIERLATLIVNHLALFNHPIPAAVLKACPDIREMDVAFATSDRDAPDAAKVNEHVDRILMDLVRRGLTSRYTRYVCVNRAADCPADESVAAAPHDIDRYAFALDPKVGLAVRSEMRMSVYGMEEVVPFQVTLYAAQATNGVKPEPEHFFMVKKIMRQLVTQTHRHLVEWGKKLVDSPPKEDDLCGLARDLADVSDKLRAAYTLVRGTFSISVISRLNGLEHAYDISQPFEEYRAWMRELLNASIQLAEVSQQLRRYPATKLKQLGIDAALPVNQPFFRDEVTWLYNERAMVSFIQGRLFDAQPLFDKAMEISEGRRSPSEPISYRATQRRIQLNQSIVNLERGQIRIAATQIEQVMHRTAPRRKGDVPSSTHLFASGYLALCNHLSEDFKQAEVQYADVVDRLRIANEPRGLSIFLRHYADLLRAKSKALGDERYRQALQTLSEAEQIAEGIGSMDLQIYALIARARLHRDMEERPDALRNLRYAETYAHSMGNQKMMTEVFKVRGEVLLADGEATQAGYVTAQAVAMAKRNGMRLRKVSAILIQAKIMHMRGQKDDARHLLREALIEAKTFGYATKISEATRLLAAFQED